MSLLTKKAKVVTLFHGTCAENAKSLVKNGWQPNQVSAGGNAGQARYLYLSTGREDALWFAEEKGCDVVLEVTVPMDALAVDPEDGIGETVEDEMNNKHGLPGKLVLTHPLSAEHFRIVKTASLLKKADTHENASTQINVPQDIADRIIAIGKELIPEEHLAGEGRVTIIHVTVKYGVQPSTELLQQAIAGRTSFPISLGNTVAFTNSDNNAGGTPIVIEVHGRELEALHDTVMAEMGTMPDDLPYVPHITVAYVKPDEAQHYVGNASFAGIEFTAEAVTLSPYDDSKQVDVPLAKAAASPAQVTPEIPQVAPQVPAQQEEEQDEEEVQRDEPATPEQKQQQPKPKAPLLKKQPKQKAQPYKAPKPPAKNPDFKKWFGKSKVTDSTGKPLVVYHGTTHDFTTFDPSKTTKDSFYGQGLYFTSSKMDLENYASDVGPDITRRVEFQSEEVMRNWEDNWDDVKDQLGMSQLEEFPAWGTYERDELNEKAKQEAKKEVAGGSGGMSMPVYLSLQNPVIVQKRGGTTFEMNYDEDSEQESGTGVDLYNAMISVGANYYTDAQEMWNNIIGNIGGEFTAYDFEKIVREGGETVENPDNGNIETGSFIADVYRDLGFDGIIQDAYAEFGPRPSGYAGGKLPGMKMDQDTKHYILWDSSKVKSAIGNVGKYDPKNPNITAGKIAYGLPKILHRGPQGFDVEVRDGKRVGFLQIDVKGDTAIVNAIDVDEDYQRQGIATKLYAAAKAELKKRGVKILKGSLEGSGPAQIRQDVFGEGNTKFYHGGDEVDYNKAVQIMDKDYGYTRAETRVAKKAYEVSDNLDSGGGLIIESDAGTIILNNVEDGSALFVEGIELNEGFEGKGEGQKLYDAAFKTAKKLGYEYVYSSNENNRTPEANKAWQRLSQRYKVENIGDAMRVKLAAGEKSVGDLGLAKRVMHELIPVLGVQLPEPELKITNAPRANWLGQDNWQVRIENGKWSWDETTTITLQKSILNDENTLRRILAHELCHHAEALTTSLAKAKEEAAKGTGQWGFKEFGRWLRYTDHGPEWKKYAQKFNAKYGAGFVTKTSDETYAVAEPELRPYHILLKRDYDGKLAYEVAARITKKMQIRLDRMAKDKDGTEYRLTKTNDQRFYEGHLIGSFYWMHPKDENVQATLEELWEKGQKVLPSGAADEEDSLIEGFKNWNLTRGRRSSLLKKAIPQVEQLERPVSKDYDRVAYVYNQMYRAGKPSLSWKDFQKMFPKEQNSPLFTQIRQNRPQITLEDLDRWLEEYKADTKHQNYTLEHSTYRDPKTSYRDVEQLVLRVNQSASAAEIIGEDPLISEFIGMVQQGAQHYGHPVARNTVGWLRVDFVSDEWLLVDEVQSDLVNAVAKAKQMLTQPNLQAYIDSFPEALKARAAKELKEHGINEQRFQMSKVQVTQRGYTPEKLDDIKAQLIGLFKDWAEYAIASVIEIARRHGIANVAINTGENLAARDPLVEEKSNMYYDQLAKAFGFKKQQVDAGEMKGNFWVRTAGKRDEAVTSLTVGTDDPNFPSPVLVRWEQGMRWREVLKAVKALVGEVAGKRVPWGQVHIWASLWQDRASQEAGWEAEKSKGRVMYDVLHNGSYVRVDHAAQPVAMGGEILLDQPPTEINGVPVYASHKTPPLSDTRYENPEMGQETNAYANIPERVKGVEELPSLEELAPQMFTAGARGSIPEGTTFRTEVHDAPRGQIDAQAQAWLNGEMIGYVNFAVTDIDVELDDTRYYRKQQDQWGADEWERIAELPEQAWVKYVFVKDEYRRMGIATGMYEQIKADYPGIKITSSGTTGEGGKMREKMKERGMFASALLNKKGQYAEGQAMTQHTDHAPHGMYKVLKSNPFADEIEELRQSEGEEVPELNPVLPGTESFKGEGQPQAKGEDQIGQKLNPNSQNNLGRTSSKQAAEVDEDFSMSGKVGPFYRIDTMRPDDIAAFHGKRFAVRVVNGQKVTVYRAGKPNEQLTPGTFLSANKRVAEGWQHEGTTGFGGPIIYKYEVDPKDLIHVENFEGSELVYKPRAKKALKLNLEQPPIGVRDALDEIEARFPANPMNPKERMVMDGDTPIAVFEVAARDGKLRLKDIRSLEKGKGSGRAALQAITMIADKHGAEMELTASPFGDEKTRLDKDQLQNWYRRHNFEDEPGYDPALGYMVRRPKKADTDILIENEGGNVYGDYVSVDELPELYSGMFYSKSLQAKFEKKGVHTVVLMFGMEVDKSKRGKGYGDDLLDQFLKEAKGLPVLLNADTAQLQVEGFDLVSWYSKHGFQKIETPSVFPLMVRW